MKKNTSAIWQMFYLQRGNYENVKLTKRYTKVLGELADLDENFIKLIERDSKLLKLYKEVSEKQDELCAEDAYIHFAEGFRFGVLMGLDIAENTEE